MNIEPRTALHGLIPVAHGALDFAELERLNLHPSRVLDFSANTNAYGPSPIVRRAIANAPITRYPDRFSLSLHRVLANHLGIERDRILIGNGSTEFLWLIALAYLSADDLDHWVKSFPNTLFVIDEAYLNFATNIKSAIYLEKTNLLILRSMTKDYALAGLRLGYAVGSSQVITSLRKVQPPWSVNTLAQAAGIAALQDQEYLRGCMSRLQRNKNNLIKALQEMDYSPIPSATHYFLLPVEHSADFRSALLKHAILVRDCTSFGLPNFIRIATRKPEEDHRLLRAMKGNNP